MNPIEDAGLKLQDLTSKIAALKIKWIKSILDEDLINPWKSYLGSKFKYKIGEMPFYNLCEND